MVLGHQRLPASRSDRLSKSVINDAKSGTERPVRPFAEPIRSYKMLGVYDDLAAEGTVIREEQDGFKFLLNLQKHDKLQGIRTLEAILSRLKA